MWNQFKNDEETKNLIKYDIVSFLYFFFLSNMKVNFSLKWIVKNHQLKKKQTTPTNMGWNIYKDLNFTFMGV